MRIITKEIVTQAIAMMPVASDDATRYHICGVLIQSHGEAVTLVATDGHMLFETTLKGQCPVGTFMLRSDEAKALKMVLKDAKNFTEVPCVCDKDGLLIGFDFGVKVRVQTSQVDSYPNYQAVIPTLEKRTAIAVNADYLMRLAKAHANLTGNKSPNIRIEFDPANPTGPILVQGDARAIGVVMPVRDDRVKEYATAFAGGA